MKAITIWQPWSSLLAARMKKYETRGWATAYRGPIAIHAAVKPVSHSWAAITHDVWREALKLAPDGMTITGTPEDLAFLPTGQVLAVAKLVACHLIDDAFVASLDPVELELGDFTPGRYAWEFENMEPLPFPVSAKGGQGLWCWKGGAT